jgi:hypothetical protein
MPISSPHPPFFGPAFPPKSSNDSDSGGTPAGFATISCTYDIETEECATEQPDCGGSWSINEVGSATGTGGINYGGGSIPSNGNFTVSSSAYCAGYPAYMVVSATCSDGTTVVLDSFVSVGYDANGDCPASEYSRSFVGACCPPPEEKCITVTTPASWSTAIPLETQCSAAGAAALWAAQGNTIRAKITEQILKDIPAVAELIAREQGLRPTDLSAVRRGVMQYLEQANVSSQGGRCSMRLPPADAGRGGSVQKAIGKSIQKVFKELGVKGIGGGGGFAPMLMIIVPTVDMLFERLDQEINRLNHNFGNVKCALNSPTSPNPSAPTHGTPVGVGAPAINLPISAIASSANNPLPSIIKNNLLLSMNHGYTTQNGQITFRRPKTEI